MIPIYKPYLPPNSLKYAHDALNSTWVSSQGEYLQIVVKKLQNLLDIQYIIPLNNGTSACHLVAKALHKAFPSACSKKKIIVPNNVYVAAWNAFLYDNNYQLIPVDADVETWNVDIAKLEETIIKNPEADVLIVHNIGNVINVPKLKNKFPNTNFVEDNCEGFLGSYDGKFTGKESFASSISFFGNKNITSGEGGAFITNSKEIYEYIKCIHGQGQSSTRFLHKELGYNYRMTNIQAAILCGQFECLKDIIDLKMEIFNNYRNAFKDRDDIKVQTNDENTKNSNWMFGIRIPRQLSYKVAEEFFNSNNIEIRPMFYSIFSHKHLENNANVLPADCTVANLLNQKCIILPSFPGLNSQEQSHIINVVNKYANLCKVNTQEVS